MTKKDTLFFGIIFLWIITGTFDIFIYNFIDPFYIQFIFLGILLLFCALLYRSKRFNAYIQQESRFYRRLFFKKSK